ncbi:DUF5131 family protein [candidate division KSB1 bacterium]|nr:DUF5131 family protein [candidate division KSB1 bacterium]
MMSDLFHEDVPFDFIAHVWDEMICNPKHRFIVLTKRPERMMAFENWYGDGFYELNIAVGVSVENQKFADIRIPLLLNISAALRFVSVEPLLSRLKLINYLPFPSNISEYISTPYKNFLDWVIVGGETGDQARPVHPDWIRTLRNEALDRGVPFFFKQWGEWIPLEMYTGSGYPIGDKRMGFFAENHPGDKEFFYGGVSSHGQHMVRVGRKKAGRLLDDVEWMQFPEMLKLKRAEAL